MARPYNSENLRRIPAELLPTLDALRQQGETYQSIADALGVGFATIYRACNRLSTYKGMA